jgi:mannose-6-phosphate isomerase
LEISALPGRESIVANGALAGLPVSAAIERWGSALTGLDGGAFPLLLKLLDAREMLSVQVHPDDAYAQSHEGKLGKTEAWLVLSANPGAKLVYGVESDTRQALRECVEQGRLEGALRWIGVAPGDVLYIPHGMVHALGGGIVVYEIQQSSDVTYRFWDWGRVGADGRPRALHTESALAVSRPELKMDKLPGATMICEGGSQTAYIADENFELRRLNVAGRMPLAPGRMRMITAFGEGAIRWPDDELELRPGDSVMVPAELGGVSIVGRMPAMCAMLPDRDALRAELSYRAELVAGL